MFAVYISLGSNLGDRAANLRRAVDRLSMLGQVTKVSGFYETEPMEFKEQDWFLNACVELRTELPAAALLRNLLEIERELGRNRSLGPPKGPRTLDLDILVYGNQVVDAPQLKIPHPSMHERRFVLAPLAEIAPQWKHPVLEKTVRQLLQELGADAGEVRRTS